ncbi:MAG: AMP-binding protein [Pseudonocardia sp.]|nr:AMP-binding protein [Pseudonocardia sp.]
MLHHRGQVNSACLSYGELLGIRPGDPIVNVMPMFHTAGSVLATLSAIGTCATHVLQPWFDPALHLRLIEDERSILFGGVPTMLPATLDHPAMATTNTSSVRVALSGGATVPPALVRRVEETFGVPMGIIHAQTEASPGITMTPPVRRLRRRPVHHAGPSAAGDRRRDHGSRRPAHTRPAGRRRRAVHTGLPRRDGVRGRPGADGRDGRRRRLAAHRRPREHGRARLLPDRVAMATITAHRLSACGPLPRRRSRR